MGKKQDKENMNTDLNKHNEKASHAFDWLIEFSKKVVFGSFIVYLISTLVIITILFLNYLHGDTTGFELFITETNDTFKVVVGGYVIKAALENVIKIGGAKYQDLIKIKHRLYKTIMTKNTGVDFINSDKDSNE